MTYLLDTNICSYIINEHPALVVQRLIQAGRGSLAISTVTVAELAFGIAKSTRPYARTKLENFLSKFPIANWGQDVAWVYGHVRKTLQARGQRICERDLLLACQALAMDATMVTNKASEFERVEGLKVENWAEVST